VGWPKFAVPPITSLVWMEPSALMIVLSPLASFHVRVCGTPARVPLMPLNVCAKPAACEATYLPTLPFSAVLPSPVRS
jgi:hypothetical protein